jgi:hypothetical protein
MYYTLDAVAITIDNRATSLVILNYLLNTVNMMVMLNTETLTSNAGKCWFCITGIETIT